MATVDLTVPADAGLILNAAELQVSLRDCFARYASKPPEALTALVRQRVLAHLEASRWSQAGTALRANLDATAWPNGQPWKRPVRPGSPDFWRCHAIALDRLDELLGALLPQGIRCINDGGFSVWRGAHPNRLEPVDVDLLCGAWNEPGTGRGGRDLVGLTAYLTGQGQDQAARWLAKFYGFAEVRHA